MLIFLKENKEKKHSFEFIKKINEIDNSNYINVIFNDICSNEKITNKLSEDEINFIFNNLYLEENISDDFIKNNLKKNCRFLFQKFKQKKIQVKDFYKDTKEITVMFKIFNNIYKDDELKEMKKSNFYRNSFKSFNTFESNINENKISFQELESLDKIIEKPSFNEKIKFFSLSENQKNDFYDKIKNKITLVLKNKEKIKICNNIWMIFLQLKI